MSNLFGDDPVQKQRIVSVGDDLYGVSVSELAQRIDILKAEIERTQAALAKKQVELSEAETLFAPKES